MHAASLSQIKLITVDNEEEKKKDEIEEAGDVEIIPEK